MTAADIIRDAAMVEGTHWYANHGRAFHHEAPDWVRSGKALCGASIRNPGWAVTSPMPGVQRLCKRCLAALRVQSGYSGLRETDLVGPLG